MGKIKFEWDENKNKSNYLKHNVKFEEAQTVFYDENALQFFDDNLEVDEDRFLMIGVSHKLRILLVCHCERNDGKTIRIISARKATKNEIEQYKEQL